MTVANLKNEFWPALPLGAWRETQATLHLWTQVVGKVKLALSPFLTEWWNVAFSLTPRGLTTGTMPSATGAFAIDFDFIDHQLAINASDGRARKMPLVAKSVADFYRETIETLEELGITVKIDPLPSELPNSTPFDQDRDHSTYDPEFAQRWWRIMLQTESVMQRFRAPFIGKSSPVNFFWGSFDLSATRFSGRPATPPAGAPRFVQLAESQENFAYGLWPGNGVMTGKPLDEPAFYAYIFPEPPKFFEATVRPEAAFYDADLGEFVLRYEDARRAPSVDGAILDFFQSAYEAAATLGNWNRRALERDPPRRLTE